MITKTTHGILLWHSTLYSLHAIIMQILLLQQMTFVMNCVYNEARLLNTKGFQEVSMTILYIRPEDKLLMVKAQAINLTFFFVLKCKELRHSTKYFKYILKLLGFFRNMVAMDGVSVFLVNVRTVIVSSFSFPAVTSRVS